MTCWEFVFATPLPLHLAQIKKFIGTCLMETISLDTMFSCDKKILIQDFSDGRTPISQGLLSYYLVKFSLQLHGNEENWTERERRSSKNSLCRSATNLTNPDDKTSGSVILITVRKHSVLYVTLQWEEDELCGLLVMWVQIALITMTYGLSLSPLPTLPPWSERGLWSWVPSPRNSVIKDLYLLLLDDSTSMKGWAVPIMRK